jgi:hypothetical protein
VLALAGDIIEEHTSDHELIAAGRNAILADSRLLAIVHERFEVITGAFVEHMREREGGAVDPARARLLSRLVVTIFDSALERAESDPSRPFSEHFDAAVADARAVLA